MAVILFLSSLELKAKFPQLQHHLTLDLTRSLVLNDVILGFDSFVWFLFVGVFPLDNFSKDLDV